MAVPHGSLIYLEMFARLDEFHQQEVVEALIQHICSSGGGGGHAATDGSAAENPATAALIVLQELAETRWEHLVRFSALAVSLLEFLEYMGLAQIKRIMELLAKMAYGFSDADESKKRSVFAQSLNSTVRLYYPFPFSNESD